MDSWIFLIFILGVAASVEVHFENKDGGFFLKHTPRQYYPSRLDNTMSTSNAGQGASVTSSSVPSSSILSIDKFTVFQTSEPASVRATYGPFSTKQTVPARYIVPDPLETLPGPERRNVTASSNAAMMDVQDLGARHLDMSAHLVGTSISRDSPVLRVLFHAGSEAGGRRQLLARHQRVCVLLQATLPGKNPLTAACSPDGEDGVCLAQITIPADWWPSLPPPDSSGHIKLTKTPPRLVQVAYSVLEPRTVVLTDDMAADTYAGVPRTLPVSSDSGSSGSGGCRPRVQIQPVTPLGKIPLTPNRADYKEIKADDSLVLLVPHGPLYPRSRLHVPVFLYPQNSMTVDTTGASIEDKDALGPPIVTVVLRARAKSGVRILDASSSSPNWILTSDINGKNTAATFTVKRRRDDLEITTEPTNVRSAEEIMTMLLEASEEGDGSSSWDDGRIMWSVRYTLEGDEEDLTMQTRTGSSEQMQLQRQQQLQQQHHHHHHHIEKRKFSARLEIQKDDIQAVLPISKNWEVMNTAVLTGRQVSQAMKVFIVSQAGTVADVTLQSSCHSEDESVLKVSSSCSSVYVDGSEIRGSSNASVLVKYGTYTGLARFTVWMPEFPLEVTVTDSRLSQIKGWKVPEGHPVQKNKRSLNQTDITSLNINSNNKNNNNKRRRRRRTSVSGLDTIDNDDDETINHDNEDEEEEDNEEEIDDIEVERFRDDRWDAVNSIDRSMQTTTACRLRFQQSPVEVHARFLAAGHDSGRESYFVNRRTWLRVTDLVVGLVRVSDPRIATLLQDRIVQGRGVGRTEVQVLSPITGRVIGAKEIRVGNDRVSIARLSVKVVSGLQLTISPDTAIENGYVAETSVTRRLTAQYQEGLLDIDIEFSDSMKTPLREIAVSDYHLTVESLDPEVVAFAPMVASHHPRVIAVGEGHGDLLRVTLQLAEACRMSGANAGRRAKGSRANNNGQGGAQALATATANVEVDFASSDLPHRPEFVQNDGGGMVQGGSSHHHRERKTGREVAPDLHDILIGGVGGVGVRHHNASHMTPLEIGMYVLLAAFGFAILVFVISCVVYASKFKPHQSDSPLPSIPMLGAVRARAAAASQQLASARRPRESTTNAHDWVWLGRATLERAACAPQQVRVTNNPLAGEVDDDAGDLGTSFDNPNHIELPAAGNRVTVTPIDTTTYCKRDRVRNYMQKNDAAKTQILDGPVTSSTRNGNEVKDVPPPLPPHGITSPASVPASSGAGVTDLANNNEDYKPPVPPHRNTGVTARLPETPKKHQHRNHHANHRHVKHHHHHHHPKTHSTKPSANPVSKNEEAQTIDDEEFVELKKVNEEKPKEIIPREIKRATIVGNPMFSSNLSSSSSSSSSSTVSNQELNETMASLVETPALDDLNLGMDYNQIMQYFDNLKESNA
ncbi:transmembrane protein 132E isoform X1 [Microplitis mediator]|uniref:transmembrane protein 132E isoform X1 n=1 Tax=Microplitis mediator TaxID=375433 RepID=UPI0025537248|nr:transmembrane protein 132E isoform X1 [Microplitis mediator]